MIHRKGFSLIETIVAATLVLTVFTSSYALINYTLVNINYIQNGLTALFLAQEGVELTIAQRDANWIANRSFDAGLSDGVYMTVFFRGSTTLQRMFRCVSARPKVISTPAAMKHRFIGRLPFRRSVTLNL